MVSDVVWRSYGAGAIRIRRMADSELPCGGSEGTGEKPATRTTTRSSWRGGSVHRCERGVLAFARAAGSGSNNHARQRGDADGTRPARCDVHCGGYRHLNSGFSKPVDLDCT